MSAHDAAAAVARAHAELVTSLDQLVQVLVAADDTEAEELATDVRRKVKNLADWQTGELGQLLDLWEL
ncbi:MAG: hypothetical protein JST64_10490 [Actinobacteria bacterium]|nr:hypothetical protein [Actinomycetota bacterium]